MKKLLLLACLAILSHVEAVQAQTPQNKKHSMIFEFSETWCGPCGAYGIPIADTVDHKLTAEDKGYLLGIKTSSSPSTMNALGGGGLNSNFSVQGVPTFIVNNTESNAPTGNNTGDVTSIMGTVTTFNATPVVASTAANMTISGTVLTVNAKAKFWTAATGEYYMTAFLAEDKIVAAQNAASSNTVHPHVLRGIMATSGTSLTATPWGEQVGSATIAANTEFSKTYKVTIDAAWQKANLEVYIVLFKKNGNKYEYVNAEKAKTGVTGINNTAVSFLEQATLYPNPTGTSANLELVLPERMQISLSVTDVLGRTVYVSSHALNAGQHTLTIPASGFSSGTYDVTIQAENRGRISKKLVVNK